MKQKVTFKELIIWESEDFIACNKPPFISTLEDRSDTLNLLKVAREYCPSAQACHRLDKDTSGVILFAKNPESYRHMSIQFEKRVVEKLYHAVVDGIHDFKNELVDAPIAKQDDGTVRISKRDGKSAQTYFSTLQVYRMHTLLECKPITGRMHQIRIHLTTLNSPITGDDLYGGKPFFLSSVKRGFNLKKFAEEEPLMKRMALHARSLSFKTLQEAPVSVEAPYPKDFQALIRQLQLNR
ncbi:MAG: RNA pseudouridine synthase [Cyclobacteriaceae bacterium]|nr:RNA pseudouridine synthase [Cyclobacteriaceae bacterium]